jgi:hypothetical protein
MNDAELTESEKGSGATIVSGRGDVQMPPSGGAFTVHQSFSLHSQSLNIGNANGLKQVQLA